MALSPFDKRLLAEGLAHFERPRLARLLEMLGTSEADRVEALAALLRNSSDEEIDEMVHLFDRALARVTREQARAQDRAERADRARRRR